MKEVSEIEAHGWRSKFGNMFAEIGKAAFKSVAEKDLHAQVALLGLDVLLDIVLNNDRCGQRTPGYVYKTMAHYGLTEVMSASSTAYRYTFTAAGRNNLAARKYVLDNPPLPNQLAPKVAARIIEPLSLDMLRDDADWNF